jgi:shikimate kinase
VLSEKNRALWGRQAVVLYLAADIPLLVARLGHGPDTRRPPLSGLPLEEELVACLREREPLYMAVMDHMLQACRSPEQLVEDALVALGLAEWDGEERERLLERW